MIESLETRKIRVRKMARSLRDDCDPALGAVMAGFVLRDCRPPSGAVIAGFMPLPGEISTLVLLERLHGEGFALALPVTPPPGEALIFRSWQPGAKLLPGRFGTSHTEGEVMVPDFILLPLLAFDAQGHRLGHGGGYYDRTLAALPDAFRLGCAFAAQELPEVPAGPTDMRLHAVATERGVMTTSFGLAQRK